VSALDHLLARFHSYRRLRGGAWWLCAGRREFAGLMLWVNEEPPLSVHVVYWEDYRE
jgi:hypothetical protein